MRGVKFLSETVDKKTYIFRKALSRSQCREGREWGQMFKEMSDINICFFRNERNFFFNFTHFIKCYRIYLFHFSQWNTYEIILYFDFGNSDPDPTNVDITN